MNDPLIGREIGGCQIVSVLGRGGMAVVYKAYQKEVGRYVAIKVLPPTLAQDPSFVVRFKREAQAVAGIHHPNVIQIYGAGLDSGYHYIIMELLEGGTLTDRIKRGALSPSQAAVILTGVAAALDCAHRGKIVHRDIKPSNVLFAKDGRPVLSDFGIARSAMSPSITSPGGFVGTPEYISPEQVEGKKVDARSDIYSLGIVLYQMLSGRVPFTSETPTGILYAQVHKQPPALAGAQAKITPAMESVIFTALAKNPAARFASAGQMAGAFQAAVSGGVAPVALRPGQPAPLLPILVGVVLFAMVGVLIVASSATPKPAPITFAASATSTVAPAANVDNMGAPTSTLAAAPTGTPAPRATATALVVVVPTSTLAPMPQRTSGTGATVATQQTQLPAPQGTAVAGAAIPASYPAPQVTAPANGVVFNNGARERIVLSWSEVGALGDDEYYVVTIPHRAGIDEQWTKNTSVVVPEYMFGLGPADRRYTWDVRVKRFTGTKANGGKDGPDRSAISAPRTFIWNDGQPASPISPLPRPAPKI